MAQGPEQVPEEVGMARGRRVVSLFSFSFFHVCCVRAFEFSLLILSSLLSVSEWIVAYCRWGNLSDLTVYRVLKVL